VSQRPTAHWANFLNIFFFDFMKINSRIHIGRNIPEPPFQTAVKFLLPFEAAVETNRRGTWR
jgi:hypothetical protein